MPSDTGVAAMFAGLEDYERLNVTSFVERLLKDEPVAVAFVNLLGEVQPSNQFTVDMGEYELTGHAAVDTDNGPAKLDIVLQRADGQPFGNGESEFSLTFPIDDILNGVESKDIPIVAVAPCAGGTEETATE